VLDEYEDPGELFDPIDRITADRNDDTVRYLANQRILKLESEKLAKQLMYPFVKPQWMDLRSYLAIEDNEEEYALQDLLPLGGNALFAGRYKAGKTTFNCNLIRSWADGIPFLGRFECNRDPERPVVTIFNYELSDPQFRRWLRRFNIQNLDLVNVVSLRGKGTHFQSDDVKEWAVNNLRESKTGLWIIDPASRAMDGSGDAKENVDVVSFTNTLDEIKEKSGTKNLVLNVHMPHQSGKDDGMNEHAFGSQAWSAWADSLWYLTLTEDKKDGYKRRWFKAEGRDVDVHKMLVHYDERDMSVTLTDMSPEQSDTDGIEKAITLVVKHSPGISRNMLIMEAKLKAHKGEQAIMIVLDNMIRHGAILIRPGRNRSKCHYVPDGSSIIPGMPDDDE